MDKGQIRARMVERRNQTSLEQKSAWSRLINERLLRCIKWSRVQTLHCYKPNSKWDEPNTDALLEYIAKSWPQIEVYQPSFNSKQELPDIVFDVIIVPTLAFSDDGSRIGRGAGWYDRFLATQLTAIKLGIAYELSRIDRPRSEAHDIPLDIIATESQLYLTSYAPKLSPLLRS